MLWAKKKLTAYFLASFGVPMLFFDWWSVIRFHVPFDMQSSSASSPVSILSCIHPHLQRKVFMLPLTFFLVSCFIFLKEKEIDNRLKIDAMKWTWKSKKLVKMITWKKVELYVHVFLCGRYSFFWLYLEYSTIIINVTGNSVEKMLMLCYKATLLGQLFFYYYFCFKIEWDESTEWVLFKGQSVKRRKEHGAPSRQKKE